MTSTVWANIILAVPFVLAIVGIPLWITWQRTDTAPDFSGARRYLAAKAARRAAPAGIRTPGPRPEPSGPAAMPVGPDDRLPVLAGRR